MNTRKLFKKTKKGEEEIGTRKHGLPQNLRSALILVDGASTVAKIIEKGAGFPNIEQSLDELAAQGFIEADETVSVASIKEELIAMARETLGADAEKIVSKIQEAPDTKLDIEAAVGSCKKLVRLTIDEKKAEELMNKCTAILGRL